jgi:hypothetical protein
MKKGICAKCGEHRWVNQHHIYPREHFGAKNNKETVQLCLDCHVDIHQELPKEKQSKAFYKEFTIKFIGGFMVLFMVWYFIFN